MTNSFFDPRETSLKVCGVTQAEDAFKLVEIGVPAIGVNFWPKSKRYIEPNRAAPFLKKIKNQILRVGVFVNEKPSVVEELFERDLIDVAQFHGDETPSYCEIFFQKSLPFIRALGVKNADSIENIKDYKANAILLDAHAPLVYGGTGDTFDWNLAKLVINEHPELPVMLAGGITSANAKLATETVRPAALDIASGSESSPGIKNFEKITAIQSAVESAK